MGLTRRAFLGFAVAAPCLVGRVADAAPPEQELDTFLEFSRQVTGFDDLDLDLGRRYWLALRDWEPALTKTLSRQSVTDAQRRSITELVIESWYTGTVPTNRGTRTITFEGALGWACLPRDTPVTFCRP